MVKIRLTQTGKRNAKKYRIVVQEEGVRRDGNCIEILGYYDPLVKPAKIEVDMKRVEFWIKQGAQMTDGTRRILVK